LTEFDLSLSRKHEKRSQIMQRFAFIELFSDTTLVSFVKNITQDENGFIESTIFLQSLD